MYKFRKSRKIRNHDKFKWAVFNIETRFRLTEYTTRTLANLARMNILHDQPELKGKIAIKQRNFEK